MQETSLPEDSLGLVAGRLEGMNVPDLMWLLCQRRKTGVLHLSRHRVVKKVYFQDGRIVFATSSERNDRLGEALLREGMIALEQFQEAERMLCGGKRLGTLLVELGHLRPGDLVRGVVAQVREIVLEPFTWEEGAYRFDEGPLPTQEVITLGMKTGAILLQGIRRIRSFTRIRRSVGGMRQRFVLAPGASEGVEELALTDGERLVLSRLEQGSATIETLCDEIYASNFEIHQALWAFRVLGLVAEADEHEDEAAAGPPLAGRIGPDGIFDALVRLCRAGETGVLHVSRGSLERTFHLREGRSVFATSNSIDDGLVAHLLRRGVISVRDREETARRLLSNKRVGTILLEMGVLNERDLRDMVREQLTEVVCDTFCWEDGEFSFVPGDLPTVEDIVLDVSVEDLVSEGIRRVTSWPRVQEGCGAASGALLALTPDYLDVLDRMKVGPDEWEVVSCIGAPKSVIEICRAVPLRDFRVCQILWALRLLGAIRWTAAAETTESAHESRDVEAAAGSAPLAEPVEAGADAPAAADVIEEAQAAEVEEAQAAGTEETRAQRTEPARVEESLEAPIAAEAEVRAEAASEAEQNAHEPSAGPPREEPQETHEAAPPSGPPGGALDAPVDATAVLSRSEVEAALGLAPRPAEAQEFELAEPGAGEEAHPAESRVHEEPPERDFEIGEPGADPQEQEHAPTAESGPSFELADALSRTEADAAADHAAEAEVPSIEQTCAISSEEIARAMGAVPEGAPSPTEPSHPTAELDRAIQQFNRLHRLLYRAIRSEVGAGTANFIHSCRGGLGDGLGELFAESRLLPDGTWDPEGLKKRIRERCLDQPWPRLQTLLDREFEMLKPNIDDARVQALHDQLRDLVQSS
jgi:hypothetical protein